MTGGSRVAGAFDLEVFFDGACPLCAREAAHLRRLDRAGRLRFTDLAAPGFDAGAAGIPWNDLMDRIHARLADGTVVEGVEVFRRLYSAVGLGWLVAPTRLPGVSHLLDLAYRAFARNRLRLTGRCPAPGCRAHAGRRGAAAAPPGDEHPRSEPATPGAASPATEAPPSRTGASSPPSWA